MIQHVHERCTRAAPETRVIVATDDERIEAAVRAFGGEVMMTPTDLRSGSERVAWVASSVQADLIVNVQGDEPLLPGETLHAALRPLHDDASVDIGTAACALNSMDEARNPDIVKVVTDQRGRALYFSRAPIPYYRATAEEPPRMLRHIGLYAFRREALLRFASLPEGRLEGIEMLEQLRALEYGMCIGVTIVSTHSQAVDTPEDLETVRAMTD